MIRFNDQWNPDYFNLSGFAESVDSQNMEDGVIEAIFKVCGTDSKYCVDIGANNGIWCSNVRNLINQGWNGLMVESDKQIFEKLKKNYEEEKWREKVILLNEVVTKDNIEWILNKSFIPIDNLDLLNIDIDGKDLEVWEGINKYKPNLVIIECNTEKTALNEFYYDSTDIKGGASVGSLYKVAREKGYDYLCVECCNAFFIEREFGRKLLR